MLAADSTLCTQKGLLRSVVPDGAARIFSPDEVGTAGHTFCMAEDANKV